MDVEEVAYEIEVLFGERRVLVGREVRLDALVDEEDDGAMLQANEDFVVGVDGDTELGKIRDFKELPLPGVREPNAEFGVSFSTPIDVGIRADAANEWGWDWCSLRSIFVFSFGVGILGGFGVSKLCWKLLEDGYRIREGRIEEEWSYLVRLSWSRCTCEITTKGWWWWW